MYHQARQAQMTHNTVSSDSECDVEMHDSQIQAAPESHAPSSHFPRPSSTQPERFSSFVHLSAVLRGEAFFDEVLKNVDARMFKDTDFQPQYAKLRARKARHEIRSKLRSISLAGDDPKIQHRVQSGLRTTERERHRKAIPISGRPTGIPKVEWTWHGMP
jgi:hypothetical protein